MAAASMVTVKRSPSRAMGTTCRAVEPFRDSTASHGSPARSA